MSDDEIKHILCCSEPDGARSLANAAAARHQEEIIEWLRDYGEDRAAIILENR